MKRYRNHSGNSGISGFETGPDYIRVKFFDTPTVFKYSYRSAGMHHVERMKQLAESGRGLNTYINRYTRDLFE